MSAIKLKLRVYFYRHELRGLHVVSGGALTHTYTAISENLTKREPRHKENNFTWGDCAKASNPEASMASTAIPGDSGQGLEEAWPAEATETRKGLFREIRA